MLSAKSLIADLQEKKNYVLLDASDRSHYSRILVKWLIKISKSSERDELVANFSAELGRLKEYHSELTELICHEALIYSGIHPYLFATLYHHCKKRIFEGFGPGARLALIVPTYNRDTRLKLSVSTILDYRLPFLDVYIHDNDSTDDTKSIVSSFVDNYPDQFISYVKHNANVGWFRTYLIALSISSFKYCMITTDDDHLTEESLSYALWVYQTYPDIGFISFDKRLHSRYQYSHLGFILAEPASLDAVKVRDSVNAIAGISFTHTAYKTACPDFLTEKTLFGHISLSTAICLRNRSLAVSIKEFDPIINAYSTRPSSTGVKSDLQVRHIQTLVSEGSLDAELYFSSVTSQAILNIIFKGSSDPTFISTSDNITTLFSGFCASWWTWLGNRIKTAAFEADDPTLFRMFANKFVSPVNASNIFLLKDLCEFNGKKPEIFPLESCHHYRQLLFATFWIKLGIESGDYTTEASLSNIFSSACVGSIVDSRLDQLVYFVRDQLSLPDYLSLWSTDYRSTSLNLSLDTDGALTTIPLIYNECLEALKSKSKPLLRKVLLDHYDPNNWTQFCAISALDEAAAEYEKICRRASKAFFPFFALNH